jgi:DNA-binding transcriptional MerR regulator/methylmalonyl-CoA mutase cobalamin-binding subunit
MTGLSLDTLRGWERRYGAVVPDRGQRGRQYSDKDVARLRSLRELVGRGYSIGAVANLNDDRLARLLEAGCDAERLHRSGAGAADLQPLFAALERYDRDGLESALNRHAVTLRPPDLVSAVVTPLLDETGKRWEQGLLRPSQEHLISAAIRSVLGGLLRVSTRPEGRPTMLFATPAGERHELGLLCAALLAAWAGASVLYVGPDLPAGDIAHAAGRGDAEIVVLSLTTARATSPKELRELARELRRFDLWVGGRAASTVLKAIGPRARHLTDLTMVIPALSHPTNMGGTVHV